MASKKRELGKQTAALEQAAGASGEILARLAAIEEKVTRVIELVTPPTITPPPAKSGGFGKSKGEG